MAETISNWAGILVTTFERCRLKLDVARARLSRWGQAASIHDDPRFAPATPPDRDSRHVRAILEGIEQLFQLAQKSSKRYEIDATDADLERSDAANVELPERFVFLAS
ncbi:Elongator complex protein 5 [Apiospora arundinis]